MFSPGETGKDLSGEEVHTYLPLSMTHSLGSSEIILPNMFLAISASQGIGGHWFHLLSSCGAFNW